MHTDTSNQRFIVGQSRNKLVRHNYNVLLDVGILKIYYYSKTVLPVIVYLSECTHYVHTVLFQLWVCFILGLRFPKVINS